MSGALFQSRVHSTLYLHTDKSGRRSLSFRQITRSNRTQPVSCKHSPPEMYVIEDKVAFVTGALGGIGRSYVKHLLKHGAKGVALVDVNDADSESFQEELAGDFGGNKTVFIKSDVGNLEDVQVALNKTVAYFKQLDIIINNAAILDEINIEACIRINLAGPAIITRLAFTEYLPKYKSAKEAIVVNTASIGGLVPVPTCPAYSASKYGLVGLGQCYGQDVFYEKDNIKILTICPGGTDTAIVNCQDRMPADLREIRDRTIPTINLQSTDALGSALIQVLKEGKTGSVWIVQHDEPPLEVNYNEVTENVLKYVKF